MREDRLGDFCQCHLARNHHHANADQRIGVVGELVHGDDAAVRPRCGFEQLSLRR